MAFFVIIQYKRRKDLFDITVSEDSGRHGLEDVAKLFISQ